MFIDIISETIFLILVSFPGALIRWVFIGFKRPLRELLFDGSNINESIGILVVVVVVVLICLPVWKKPAPVEGKALVEQHCSSCHTKYEGRMMYKPSLLQMSDMKEAFKSAYSVALRDSNHYVAAKSLTGDEKQIIYKYIASLERSFEDRRAR